MSNNNSEEKNGTDRSINYNIEECIDNILRWRKRYPKICFGEVGDLSIQYRSILKDYAEKYGEDCKKLYEDFIVAMNNYRYIRIKKNQGRLTEDQIQKCKEGNVGGVFGFSEKVEKLAKKYEVSEKDILYIEGEFGSFEAFYEQFKTGKLQSNKDILLAQTMFISFIDIDGENNKSYDNLYSKILSYYNKYNSSNFYLGIYSSHELRKTINRKFSDNLKKKGSKKKGIIDRRFNLQAGDGGITPLDEVGREYGVSYQRVTQEVLYVLRKLSLVRSKYEIDLDNIKNDALISEEGKHVLDKIDFFIDMIRLKDIDINTARDMGILEQLKYINDELQKREAKSRFEILSTQINGQGSRDSQNDELVESKPYNNGESQRVRSLRMLKEYSDIISALEGYKKGLSNKEPEEEGQKIDTDQSAPEFDE